MGRKPLLDPANVLTTIQDWIVKHGQAPTNAELQRLLRVKSTRTVNRYLSLLEAEGAIARRGSRGVAIKGTPAQNSAETVSVPLLGSVAAGALTAAEQNVEAWIRIPKTMARPNGGQLFLLRVHGNSMDQARLGKQFIENGDLVLVKRQSKADSGAIVVANVDGEATLKKFVSGPGYAVLKPVSSDPTYQPIVVDEGFRIQGVAIGILKRGAETLLD